MQLKYLQQPLLIRQLYCNIQLLSITSQQVHIKLIIFNNIVLNIKSKAITTSTVTSKIDSWDLRMICQLLTPNNYVLDVPYL